MSILDNIKKIKSFTPSGQAIEFGKKAAKYISFGTSAAFAAALAYFSGLGAAALKGFLAGASVGLPVGVVVGGYLGFQIGLVLAPFTFGLSIPVFTLLGMGAGGLVGATIFGVAGGLISLGLASGMTSLVPAGIGAGLGGIIGGYAGAVLGAAAVGWIPVIGPFLAPFGAFVGASIGAAVGAAIGGAVGYFIGKYAWSPVETYFKNIFSGHPNPQYGISSDVITGNVASFIHGTVGIFSTAWSWVVSAGSWIVNGAVSLASSIWGALTGGSTAAAGQIAAVGVGATVATAATMAIISTGILTPGKFATTQTDKGQNIIPPPQSAYVTVTKTATPSSLQNSQLPATINFEVTVTAKSVQLINVTCEDLTTLVKSDGTTTTLSVSPKPSCPATIDPNAQLKFNFSTAAQNTPDFQNASIINVFNIYYDIAQLALGSCGAGSGFSNLLPNPIPPSVGAVSSSSLSNLNSPSQIIPAAIYGAQKSGVACELLVGIDYVENTWNDQKSFINGGPISQAYPVANAALCTAYNGTWSDPGGCTINTLQDVAYYAGNIIKDKMNDFMHLGWRPPANFQEMVGAMSHYNGGGNHNCNNVVPVAYSGPCPAPFYGDDDAYAMTHFDTPHQTMYIFYCSDGALCASPYSNTRDGAATAAKEYYKAGAGPFP